MAKVGTAHLEIKPVLNEEALAAVAERIRSVIADAFDEAFAPDRASGPFEIAYLEYKRAHRGASPAGGE